MKVSSALQINFISWERNIHHAWALLLKLHLATFLHERRAFQHPWPCIRFLLSCNKHSISVLRSSKLVILCMEALTWLALQKALTHENLSSVFCIANNISFHEKKHLSCTWALFINSIKTSLSEKEAFQHPWFCILFICLVALNTALVFLEAINYWFCALKL